MRIKLSTPQKMALHIFATGLIYHQYVSNMGLWLNRDQVPVAKPNPQVPTLRALEAKKLIERVELPDSIQEVWGYRITPLGKQVSDARR